MRTFQAKNIFSFIFRIFKMRLFEFLGSLLSTSSVQTVLHCQKACFTISSVVKIKHMFNFHWCIFHNLYCHTFAWVKEMNQYFHFSHSIHFVFFPTYPYFYWRTECKWFQHKYPLWEISIFSCTSLHCSFLSCHVAASHLVTRPLRVLTAAWASLRHASGRVTDVATCSLHPPFNTSAREKNTAAGRWEEEQSGDGQPPAAAAH